MRFSDLNLQKRFSFFERVVEYEESDVSPKIMKQQKYYLHELEIRKSPEWAKYTDRTVFLIETYTVRC